MLGLIYLLHLCAWFFFINIINVGALGNEYRNKSFAPKQNYMIKDDGSMIASMRSRSSIECLINCMNSNICVAVNFNRTASVCDLYGHVLTVTELTVTTTGNMFTFFEDDNEGNIIFVNYSQPTFYKAYGTKLS